MENTQTQTPVVDTEIVIRKFQGFRWDIAEKAHIKTYALDLYDKPSFQGTIYDAAVQAIQTLPLDRQRPAKFENIFFCHPKLHRNMKFVDIDKLELSAIRHDVMEKKRLDPFLYDPDCADPTAVTLEQLYNLVFDLKLQQEETAAKLDAVIADLESTSSYSSLAVSKVNKLGRLLFNESLPSIRSQLEEVISKVSTEQRSEVLVVSSDTLDVSKVLSFGITAYPFIPEDSQISDVTIRSYSMVLVNSSIDLTTRSLLNLFYGDRCIVYHSIRELNRICKKFLR